MFMITPKNPSISAAVTVFQSTKRDRGVSLLALSSCCIRSSAYLCIEHNNCGWVYVCMHIQGLRMHHVHMCSVYASLIPRLSSMDVWLLCVLTFENSVMQAWGCTGSKVITRDAPNMPA